jgi:hypothetical protein
VFRNEYSLSQYYEIGETYDAYATKAGDGGSNSSRIVVIVVVE